MLFTRRATSLQLETIPKDVLLPAVFLTTRCRTLLLSLYIWVIGKLIFCVLQESVLFSRTNLWNNCLEPDPKALRNELSKADKVPVTLKLKAFMSIEYYLTIGMHQL